MKDKPGENMPLFNAKVNIAAQRKNAQERYGSNVDGRSGMASPTMSGLGYAEALSATVTAVENRGAGQDTTNGAYQFNMRNDPQAERGGPFRLTSCRAGSQPIRESLSSFRKSNKSTHCSYPRIKRKLRIATVSGSRKQSETCLRRGSYRYDTLSRRCIQYSVVRRPPLYRQRT